MKYRAGFVSNSSSTSIIIDLSKLNQSEKVELHNFVGWMEKRDIPQQIDINTSSSQYCQLDENRLLVYCRDESIPDWIYDTDAVMKIETDEIKRFPFDTKRCIKPIMDILLMHGAIVTESMEKDIAKEVLRLLSVDEY